MEQNMDEDFYIKAITRYAVLYDVCFSFLLRLSGTTFL